MRQHPTAWWIDKLETLKIGCGPINTLAQVFTDPHILAREMVLEMEHATGGTMKMIANPVKLSETPPDYRLPPPVLGQHTDEVLASKLGMDSGGVIGFEKPGLRERTGRLCHATPTVHQPSACHTGRRLWHAGQPAGTATSARGAYGGSGLPTDRRAVD